MAERKDLPEVVAEILIELQQMREDSNRKWEEQHKFNEEQRGINQAQTAELHYHREILEQHTVELKGLNEKMADNRQFTEHAFNSFSNLVLDRLDSIKDEMAGMREDFKKSMNLEERVRRVEFTLYGKAS